MCMKSHTLLCCKREHIHYSLQLSLHPKRCDIQLFCALVWVIFNRYNVKDQFGFSTSWIVRLNIFGGLISRYFII